MQYTYCAQGYQFSDFVALLMNHGIDNIDMPERERHWTAIPPVLFVSILFGLMLVKHQFEACPYMCHYIL